MSSEAKIVPLWLDGQEVTTKHTLAVFSPITTQICHEAAAASIEDVEAAIQSCQKAFPTWSRTKPSIRRDIILQAAILFDGRKEELWSILREETGVDRRFFEVTFAGAIDMCKDVAGRISSLQGRAPAVEAEGSSAIVLREPYGVVVGIAPWNAPLVLGLRACLQPLACGNTVVLKGSELSPKTFWAIASILHDAGLPPGCLNTIYHKPGPDAILVTNYLISSPCVRKLSFTGSTAVGSAIASLAGKCLKPIVLELGGKARAIICEDADIEKAAQDCALGAFLNSGQICMSTELVLVHKSISSKFSSAFREATDRLFAQNDETTYLATELAVERNKNLVKDAVAKGAQILHGSSDASAATKTSMRPVTLGAVSKDMQIYATESFGPLVSFVEFETEQEAIDYANDTEYGLTAAVFTSDLQRGMRLAKTIQSGAVHINGMTPHDESALPHGGVKHSGWGRFNAEEGLSEWVQSKTITWKD
ncbi:hypothetical protein LTR64_001521 [Lithohypha guttulata]|uniref:uncharacterized protein n=1 Tax=Lithohypha guttulata TaxID=1690604 RepID=UPI002DDF29EA|nr:hypothetical protein LTR51_003715 [Lithohypha guttulata]